MNQTHTLSEVQKRWHGSLKAYLIGFTASLLFTFLAYFLVVDHLLTGATLVLTLVGLALLQGVAQLLFFLHLGKEPKPHWETLIFLFMVGILLIIVAGSLWIMYDLNHRMMPDMSLPLSQETLYD